MVDKTPSKTAILDLVKAQELSVQVLSERLVRIEDVVNKQERRNDKQESRNQNAFYAVIFGFILIVAGVAVQVIISNNQENSQYNHVYDQVFEVKEENADIKDQLFLLKARNPYLK